MSNLFVTSTGTEIGKTIISDLLVKASLKNGESVGYYKPVASGCQSSEWGYRSPDEIHLIERTPLDPSDVHSTFRFEAPLSPDKAAERENSSIRVEDVLEEYRSLSQNYNRLIVEGIGGVAVPFSIDYDVTDLASDLELPAVLVASSHLGTISHTRTAVNYLRDGGVSTAGILLTPAEGRDIEETNRDHLRDFYPDKPIRLVPERDDDNEEAIVETIHDVFLGSSKQ